MSDPVNSVLTNTVQGNQDHTIFPRSPRLEFFNVMLGKPNWETSKVLDIGGNRGNLLEDGIQKNKIIPKNYYCLDVDKEAIEYGRHNFSDANWHHHSAFNHMYNVAGFESVSFPYQDNTFDLVPGSAWEPPPLGSLGTLENPWKHLGAHGTPLDSEPLRFLGPLRSTWEPLGSPWDL